MIALTIYLVTFFASAILLILDIHHEIVAEDARYTARVPAAPAEPATLSAQAPVDKAA
jgi:hypothetical protein